MQRLGRHNRPFYRISAIEKRVRRDGRVIEELGWYNPLEKDATKQINLNEERVKYWLGVGAQPSDTVRDMLARRSLVDLPAWEKQRAYDRKMVEVNKAKAAAAPAEAKKDEAKEPKAEKPKKEEPKAEVAEKKEEPKAEAAEKKEG